jgi:hypothetical protein
MAAGYLRQETRFFANNLNDAETQAIPLLHAISEDTP